MSSAFTLALAELVDVLEGVTGIETVFPQVPENMPTADEMPAIIINVMPSSTEMLRLTTRAINWAVDINVITSKRSANIAVDLPAAYDYPELIMAALDANGNLGGTIDRTVRYSDPAISADSDGAFGTVQGDNEQFVGTTIHAILTITRVGGFSA